MSNEVDGARRLEQPDDPVRREIAAALGRERGITVIPVLVGHERMPSKAALPADIQRLHDIDAVVLGERHWNLDVKLLIDVLHQELDVEGVSDAEQGVDEGREQGDAEREGSEREAQEREQREREQKKRQAQERAARQREQKEREQREREARERKRLEREQKERQAQERKRLEREQKKREGTPPERRRAVLAAGAVVCAVLIVGALAISGVFGGSSNSTTTAALTKAEFLKKGNAICKKGNQQINKAAHQTFTKKKYPNGPPPKSVQTKFATDTAIPNIQSQIDGLKALDAPTGDEAKVKAIVDSAQSALDKGKADPKLLLQNSLFTKANKLASAYGLTVCGG